VKCIVNIQNKLGRTALHIAAMTGHEDVVRHLFLTPE
jgi:ankyrin repeat protein